MLVISEYQNQEPLSFMSDHMKRRNHNQGRDLPLFRFDDLPLEVFQDIILSACTPLLHLDTDPHYYYKPVMRFRQVSRCWRDAVDSYAALWTHVWSEHPVDFRELVYKKSKTSWLSIVFETPKNDPEYRKETRTAFVEEVCPKGDRWRSLLIKGPFINEYHLELILTLVVTPAPRLEQLDLLFIAGILGTQKEDFGVDVSRLHRVALAHVNVPGILPALNSVTQLTLLSTHLLFDNVRQLLDLLAGHPKLEEFQLDSEWFEDMPSAEEETALGKVVSLPRLTWLKMPEVPGNVLKWLLEHIHAPNAVVNFDVTGTDLETDRWLAKHFGHRVGLLAMIFPRANVDAAEMDFNGRVHRALEIAFPPAMVGAAYFPAAYNRITSKSLDTEHCYGEVPRLLFQGLTMKQAFALLHGEVRLVTLNFPMTQSLVPHHHT